MRVMGIDASSTCSGVAVIENGKLIYHGIIDMKKNRDAESRIRNMISELGKSIDKYSPDVLYIEDSWNKQNIETTKMLSNIVGAVMYACMEREISFHKVLPSVWRSVVGIQMNKENNVKVKRDELKLEAVIRVHELYKIKCNDDEAESICIADAGWSMETERDLFK